MPKTKDEQILQLKKKLKAKNKEIAELKQEKFYLGSIIAWMPGHVYWLDRNNIYMGCNDNQAKHAGLSSRNEIIGKTNYDMIWKDQAAELNEVNTKTMETGVTQEIEEFAEMTHGPGLYLSQKVPLKNQKGEVIGILGVSFDITERKQMEQELKQAKEKAELASQVKTEFLKNMSHDLRTPFSGILGFSKILMRQEEDQNKRKKINYITEASESLVKLLNEIIEMSYIEQRGHAINNINFNLRELIGELFNLVTASVKFKNLDLILEYPETLPAEFFGDKIKLHRILLNLIGNAIRYTEKGFIRITVNCIEKDKKSIDLVVAVQDTGRGIDPDKFQMIFEQFTRLISGYKDICSGAGLGLYIVKKFIDELGGSISVESEVEKGSTFTCTIPLLVRSSLKNMPGFG